MNAAVVVATPEELAAIAERRDERRAVEAGRQRRPRRPERSAAAGAETKDGEAPAAAPEAADAATAVELDPTVAAAGDVGLGASPPTSRANK